MVLFFGRTKKHGFTVVLFRAQRKSICFTMVLVRVQRESIGFTVFLFTGKRKSSVFFMVVLRVERKSIDFTIVFQAEIIEISMHFFCGALEHHKAVEAGNMEFAMASMASSAATGASVAENAAARARAAHGMAGARQRTVPGPREERAEPGSRPASRSAAWRLRLARRRARHGT